MKRTRRTVAGLAGIGATVLLHSLLIAVAAWGGGSPARPRFTHAFGASANAGEADAEPGERRMVVMLTPEFEAATPPLEPPPLLPEPQMRQPSVLAITGPDALPLPPFETEPEGE